MTQPPYPTIGVAGTGVQPRLEIRDLQKNPIQFSLFIQAFNKILNMRNTTDTQSPDYINKPNSWWQMGSIHGLPYNPWSGDPNGPQEADSNARWGGYCYHASALFPPWHRLFLLMVEQAVVNAAIEIATELEKITLLPATNIGWKLQIRFVSRKYWDWTNLETAKEGIPQLLQNPNVTIVSPGGSQNSVPNPLNHYDYTLKPGATSGAPYMDTWTRTYRWANQDINPTEELYDQAATAFSVGTTFDLGDQQIQVQPVSWLRQKVAGLFTYDLTLQDPSYGPNMWGYFSNTGAQSDGVEPPMSVIPPSVEESHDMVHVDTGGNGSMSVIEYAGFDSIFFLHHSNVDRLYAFWEYLYPQYWIENGWQSQSNGTVPFVTDSGTFYQDAGSSVDHATPLHPFRNKSLNYWTSDDARGLLPTNSTNKYYTYPGIKDPVTGTEVKVDIPYDVNDLSLRQQYQKILYNEWNQDLSSVVQAHVNLAHTLPRRPHVLFKKTDDVSHLRQFDVVGQLPEFAFPGSYRLELYVLPKDLQSGSHEGPLHVVNSISVFGSADPDRCAACRNRRASGSYVRGYMHIDPRIVLYLLGRLDAAERAAIIDLESLVKLMQGSFGMRLVKPDGTALASADPRVGTNHSPLEEGKIPKLTLHSRIIHFNHVDATAPLTFEQHVSHGLFGEGNEWKAF